MHKLASTLLLFGGATLLVTWFVSPAASVQKQATPFIVSTPVDRMATELAEVDAQVDRLRGRLALPADYPAPSRDPFNFGRLPQAEAVRPGPSALPVVAPPAPALPSLVAIISDQVDGATVRRAALGDRDDVQLVAVGDVTGGLLVRDITEDAVQLVDEKSGASFRVSLASR